MYIPTFRVVQMDDARWFLYIQLAHANSTGHHKMYTDIFLMNYTLNIELFISYYVAQVFNLISLV